MPPKGKKGGNKNKNQKEATDVYVSPVNRTNDEATFPTEQTPTNVNEEEKTEDLQTSKNPSTEQESPALKQDAPLDESKKLDSSHGAEVLASSINSNWDEMNKNDVTNKTLQESVITSNLTKSQVEPEESIKKVASPKAEDKPDISNYILTRSAAEIEHNLAKANSPTKTTVIENPPTVVDPHNPFLSRSQAEVQEALARAESPVKNTPVQENNIDPLAKNDSHYNPFAAIGSPEKSIVPPTQQNADTTTANLSKSAVEVHDTTSQNTSDNKDSLGKSWIVVGEKQAEKQQEKVAEQKSASKVKVEEPEVVSKPVELTHEERLKKAADQIVAAKSLKEEGKHDKAVAILTSTLELLDPTSFSNASPSVLTDVNQKIVQCSLEAAESYNELMDYTQSIKYARALRKSNPDSIKAIYLLGIGLVRIGDLDQAHAVLHEAKRGSPSATDNSYLNLIDKELEKLDQIIQAKAKAHQAGHVDDNYVVLEHDKVRSVDDDDDEKDKSHESGHKKSSGSAAEYFLGSLVSTSAVSFVVGRYLLKQQVKKIAVTSALVGVVVGGVSMLIWSALNKNGGKGDNKKKQIKKPVPKKGKK